MPLDSTSFAHSLLVWVYWCGIVDDRQVDQFEISLLREIWLSLDGRFCVLVE
jgi:hypothetical protein